MLSVNEKDRRYDLADFENVPAKDLERHLMSRRDLVANNAQKVLTKPGEEAVVKSVAEYICPTDYDVQMGEMQPFWSNETAKVRSCGIATVEPQSFTMREVGTILDVTPRFQISPPGSICNLQPGSISASALRAEGNYDII